MNELVLLVDPDGERRSRYRRRLEDVALNVEEAAGLIVLVLDGDTAGDVQVRAAGADLVRGAPIRRTS